MKLPRRLLSVAMLGCLAVLPAGGGVAQTTSTVSPGAPSAANINITPRRLTFDRVGKSAAIYVFNQGGVPGIFDVTVVDRVMLPNGQIIPFDEAVAKPELKPITDAIKSAREMILATPRRLSIRPGAGQTVRVRVGSTAEVPPGEYRSHLTVTAVPPPDAGVSAEQAAAQATGQLSFRINSVLGLSIPVIIRVGPVDVRAAIENAKLEYENLSPDGKAAPVRTAVMSLDLVKVGVNSLFGNLEVRGSKERGEKEPLGAVRGLGVYPEIGRRTVKVTLRRIPAPREPIEIVFTDDDINPGKQLSRVTLAAP